MDADWRVLAHADALLDLGRHAEAERSFRDVLAGDPESVRALHGLARALNGQGHLVEAERVVRRALALDPEDAAGYHLLTDILCERGDGLGAVRAAERALELEPDSFTSHYQHGRALLLSPDRREPATAQARRALELAPHNPDAHNLLGMCLAAQGRTAEADACYREALAIDPHHTFAQNNLAVTAFGRGRLGRAARLLRTAAAGDPQERLLHHNMDAILVRAGVWTALLLFTAIVALCGVVTLTELSWWAKAAIGLGCLALAGLYATYLQRRLPRGLLTPVAVWRRPGWGGKSLLLVLAVLTGGLAYLSLAPTSSVKEVADTVAGSGALGIPLFAGLVAGMLSAKKDDE